MTAAALGRRVPTYRQELPRPAAPEDPSRSSLAAPARLPSSRQPSRTTGDEAAAGPAPTFQLRQHLQLVRELAVEVVLGTAQLELEVSHGSRSHRTSRPLRTSRAAAARRTRPQRPGAANPWPACPAALSIGQREERGGGGAARAGGAGQSQCGIPGRSSLARTAARPWRGRGVGRGCALLQGPMRRGSGVAGSPGAGTGCWSQGPAAASRGPGGAAGLQVGPGVGGAAGGAGRRPVPIRRGGRGLPGRGCLRGGRGGRRGPPHSADLARPGRGGRGSPSPGPSPLRKRLPWHVGALSREGPRGWAGAQDCFPRDLRLGWAAPQSELRGRRRKGPSGCIHTGAVCSADTASAASHPRPWGPWGP